MLRLTASRRRVRDSSKTLALQRAQERQQVFQLVGGKFMVQLVLVFQKDFFQRRGSVVVEVGAALADAEQRRWIELALAKLVVDADIIGVGRCEDGRRVAIGALQVAEQLAAAIDGCAILSAARLIDRRRRRESFDEGGERRQLFCRRRIIALHGMGHRFMDLCFQRVGGPGPSKWFGVSTA